MKRKILVGILIAVFLMPTGCSNNKSKEDGVNDSIVIDDNTKETINSKSEIKVSLISKIRIETYIDGKKEIGVNNQTRTSINGKIIDYIYSLDPGENPVIQFRKGYLNSLKIGIITSDKDEESNFNIVNWEERNIEGQILSEYMNGEEIRIVKDKKVYKLDNNGELKEIKAYEKLVKENGDNLNRFESHGNGNLDLHYVGDENNLKIAIVDIEEDKYYEFNKKDIEILKDKTLKVLTIEENKIYIGLGNQEENTFTIGYIENNKFYDLFSKEEETDKSILGEQFFNNFLLSFENRILLSGDRILFSGSVEGINGIWNYDIKNKKLIKVIELNEEKYLSFYLSKDKSKVFIKDFGENSKTNNFSIANINENLEISNLTNIYSWQDQVGFKMFRGWSEDSKEFYLSSFDVSDSISSDYYEVYRIEN